MNSSLSSSKAGHAAIHPLPPSLEQPIELNESELRSVTAGLDPTAGGAMLVGMALIPGVNVGIAAFALTTGLGFIIGNAYYGGGSNWYGGKYQLK